MEYIKKDELTLKIVEQVETKTQEYTMDELKQKEALLLKKKYDFCDAIDIEINAVRALIRQAKELGIMTKAELTASQSKPYVPTAEEIATYEKAMSKQL